MMKIFKKRKSHSFWNPSIAVRCEYCAKSACRDGVISCSLGRCLTEKGTCRKFQYDPLRRSPETLPPLRKYDPEEFRL